MSGVHHQASVVHPSAAICIRVAFLQDCSAACYFSLIDKVSWNISPQILAWEIAGRKKNMKPSHSLCTYG